MSTFSAIAGCFLSVAQQKTLYMLREILEQEVYTGESMDLTNWTNEHCRNPTSYPKLNTDFSANASEIPKSLNVDLASRFLSSWPVLFQNNKFIQVFILVHTLEPIFESIKRNTVSLNESLMELSIASFV